MRRANRRRGLPEKSSSPQSSRLRSAGAETFSSWPAQADLSTGSRHKSSLELRRLTLRSCSRSSCRGTLYFAPKCGKVTGNQYANTEWFARTGKILPAHRVGLTVSASTPELTCIIEARHANLFSSETL